uniref:3-hydroxyisobutyrate dehydrogenase n=1 Tax=Daphnia galeata TaxID=27404 RepID=A0A8J2RR19_9CRUS|nr:unnamed protein product [Daphnia galeata]
MAAITNVTRNAAKLIKVIGKHRTFSCSAVHHGSSKRVGFIGLGNMGGPMALNLLNKGNSVTVFDVYPEAMSKLQDAGAAIGHNPAEVAEKSDTIITMLPNSSHVQEAYAGENGVFQTAKPGSLLIDSSTIDPSVSKEMAILAEKKGMIFIDAPVSGGVMAAKAGTLTFMVGGPEHEFANAKSILEHVGKNIVYCGPVGAGQAAKICNNMLLAINMVGTAEAMNLGVRLGLDPKLLSSVINTSSGRSWSSEIYNPVPGVLPNVPASNNYEGGFGTALMTKDLGLAQNSATRSNSAIPLGSLAHQLYRLMTVRGYAKKDFSSVYEFLQKSENSN